MRKYLKWLSWRYVYCKIAKQEGTPESIAMGAAIGLFIGFLIPVGGQLIICIPLAFLFKANKLVAIAATCVTNPYTITFLYPIQCWFGSLLLLDPLKLSDLNGQMKTLLAEHSWESLMALSEDLLIPFFVGGAAWAVMSSVPAYFIVRAAVRAYRRKKEARAEMRRARNEETARLESRKQDR